VLVFNHDVLHAGLQVTGESNKYIARTELVFRRVEHRRGLAVTPARAEEETQALRLHKESAALEDQGDVEGATRVYLEALSLQAAVSSLFLPATAEGEGALSWLERLPDQVY